MIRSSERILTTHIGRLERPEEITAAMEAHPEGRPQNAEFANQLTRAVRRVVRQQAETGIDIANDGEFGKLSWNIYINSRLSGHSIVPVDKGRKRPLSRERAAFREFYSALESGGSTYYRSPGRESPPGTRWACTGPVTYIGQKALEEDLNNLRSALTQVKVVEAFVPATSPLRPGTNQYYPTDDAYYEAVGEAMRTEYKAIISAGFLLQIDDPHLPFLWASSEPALSLPEYRKRAQRYVDILNHALRDLPEDRIRYHICWGSWHGPHTDDIPFEHLIDIMLMVRAQGYAFEAANARHEHEWELWRDIKLPAGKVLIPGVVSHATNVVEHPDLIASRVMNFARLVGRDNVIAGTDCGLGYRVHDQIAVAKVEALTEGARVATRKLWSENSLGGMAGWPRKPLGAAQTGIRRAERLLFPRPT